MVTVNPTHDARERREKPKREDAREEPKREPSEEFHVRSRVSGRPRYVSGSEERQVVPGLEMHYSESQRRLLGLAM